MTDIVPTDSASTSGNGLSGPVPVWFRDLDDRADLERELTVRRSRLSALGVLDDHEEGNA
jgi:hypothetical protein